MVASCAAVKAGIFNMPRYDMTAQSDPPVVPCSGFPSTNWLPVPTSYTYAPRSASAVLPTWMQKSTVHWLGLTSMKVMRICGPGPSSPVAPTVGGSLKPNISFQRVFRKRGWPGRRAALASISSSSSSSMGLPYITCRTAGHAILVGVGPSHPHARRRQQRPVAAATLVGGSLGPARTRRVSAKW